MAVALELTPDDVVTAARSLISTNGLDGFSMRKLAAALGVNPMTIYLRFENKDALLQAVAEASLAGLELPAATGSWIDQVVELAVAVRTHLIADRALLRLHNDPARLSTGLADAVERGLELMAAAGYDSVDAVAAFRQLFWHAVGSALVAASFDALPANRIDLRAAFAATGRQHMAAHADHFGSVDADELFRTTTRNLAAGLAAAAPKDPQS